MPTKSAKRKLTRGEKQQQHSRKQLARDERDNHKALVEFVKEEQRKARTSLPLDSARLGDADAIHTQYHVQPRDRTAEIIVASFRTGPVRDGDYTFKLGDRLFRWARDTEQAHAIHPCDLRIWPQGTYSRLIDLALPILTVPSSQGVTMSANGNKTRAAVEAKPIPADPKMPLDLLGDALQASRFVVTHFGKTESNKQLRARVEIAFGKKYEPGTIARVRRELDIPESAAAKKNEEKRRAETKKEEPAKVEPAKASTNGVSKKVAESKVVTRPAPKPTTKRAVKKTTGTAAAKMIRRKK